jgi:hypothetical protein
MRIQVERGKVCEGEAGILLRHRSWGIKGGGGIAGEGQLSVETCVSCVGQWMSKDGVHYIVKLLRCDLMALSDHRRACSSLSPAPPQHQPGLTLQVGRGWWSGGRWWRCIPPSLAPYCPRLTFMCMTATVLQAHGQAYEMYRWYRPASGSNLPPGSIWFLRIGMGSPTQCCQRSLKVWTVYV